MGNTIQQRGPGNAQGLQSSTLRLLCPRGGAGMAEGYKSVLNLMVGTGCAEVALPFIPGFKRLGQEDCHESRPRRAPE